MMILSDNSCDWLKAINGPKLIASTSLSRPLVLDWVLSYLFSISMAGSDLMIVATAIFRSSKKEKNNNTLKDKQRLVGLAQRDW